MPEDLVFLTDDDWERPLPALSQLRRFLSECDFKSTARLPLPGGALDLLLDPANLRAFILGGDNLFHRSALAAVYRRAMAGHRRAVALHELLTLGRSTSLARARRLFSSHLFEQLVEADVLQTDGASVRSNVLAVPFGGQLFVSDPVRFQNHPEYAFFGRSSFSAPQFLSAIGWRSPSGTGDGPRRLLDLGCGTGFAAVAAAAGLEHVVGADIVERCLRFARLNAALNGVSNAEFHYSDVFSNISGEFDLIVSNTPCAWDAVQQATFATGGGAFGTELPARMMVEALDHLHPDGLLVAVVEAPIIRGRQYILEALDSVCGERSMRVQILPLLTEYEYHHADAYRRHAISAFVRYVVALAFSAEPSVSFAERDRLRFGCYRMRVAATRMAAAVTRPS